MKKGLLLLLLTGFLFCRLIATEQQRDSLLTLLSQQSGTDKINSLIALSDLIVYATPEQAKVYADSALNLAQDLQETKLRYKALKSRGYAHGYAGNILASIADMQEGLDYYISIADSVRIAEALSDLGYLDQARGLYDRALEKYQQSLSMREQIADQKGIAYSLNNIGTLYWRLGKMDEALDYYLQAIGYFEQTGFKEEIAGSKGNIGVIYSDMDNPEKALQYQLEALKLNRELGHRLTEAKNLNNIARIYMQQKENATAIKYLEQALEVHKSIGDNESYPLVLYNLGLAYMKDNQLEQALHYTQLAAETAVRYQANDLLMRSLTQEAAILHQLGNDTRAFLQLQRANQIKDSIFSLQQTEQIEELKAKYETERYLMENSNLKQANQKNEIIIKQQKMMFWLLVLISLLLLLFVWLVLKRNRAAAQLKAVEMEQKLLRSQMNPHFIFNSLTVIQHYILKKNTRLALNQLSALATLMRLILENSRQAFVPFGKELQTLRLYLDLQQQRYTGQFDYQLQFDPDLETANISIPPMMMQPFVENAIEHGFVGLEEKGLIQIRYILENKVLRCEVEDNGIGIDASMKAKTGTEHQSLGLGITLQRIRILEGKHKMRAKFEIIDKN
ncbi:MAG: tetratricopeptide repeat protein, partial [Bacteroidales bacterium]